MSGIDSAISKQAIGRHGFIGSLYDIRSNQFEGGNLFNRELAPSLISTTDCASSDFYVDENLSQKDTLNKLNIEGSMKLSLMAGVVQVDGSAKYLNQTFITPIKKKLSLKRKDAFDQLMSVQNL
ncbi:unnamed protein product [Rotaria sp. Silwood2]|nr:unnamed protein product [Rotaria sp. Silwood2]